MNKLVDKLKNIRLREIRDEEKNSIWHGVILARLKDVERTATLTVKIFNLHIRKIIVGVFALVIIVTSAGAGVVTASNKAVPGNPLFTLNLAMEKLQIKVAGPQKKDYLRLKFAQERVMEVRSVSASKTTTILVLEEDKESVSEVNTISFSKEENAGVEVALNNLTKLLEDTDNQISAQKIEAALQELLVLLGDDANLVIRRINGVITVDTNSKVEVKEETSLEKPEGTDEIKKTNENSKTNESLDTKEEETLKEESISTDATEALPTTSELTVEEVVEIKEEIFCRGEWRSPAECGLPPQTSEKIESDNGELNLEGDMINEIEIEDGHSIIETVIEVKLEEEPTDSTEGGATGSVSLENR